MRGHQRSSRTDVTRRVRERLREAVVRAPGLKRSPEAIQKNTFEEVSKAVVRGGLQTRWQEVLKEVVKGGPQEVLKGGVAEGRFKRRSREEGVKGSREKN